MIFISVALFAEAKPLIENLGLNILRNKTVFPIYQNENHALVISGTGKIYSAMSVVFLLNEFKDQISDSSWILNFGVCGARKDISEIGKSFLIHKITDEGSFKNVYPDILFHSPIPESALRTFDKPIFDDVVSELPNTLVDMEAFGFFTASRKFFSSDKIRVVKIVSDNLNKLEYSKITNIPEMISFRIQNSLSDILSILSIPVFQKNNIQLLAEETSTLLQICEVLRLSETERIQLKDWMIGYKMRTGNSPDLGLSILKNSNGFLKPGQTKVKTRELGKKGLYALKQFYQS
ncbi:phosphorylase [Leptospira interrogans]|uniref:Phosphorylase n=3 Tax=Leptospira interrogans TaxID=173 RepID=Q72VV0_LEPIC|nr:hypothetical protein [Leptospira interrogans]APH40206.1 Uncharacterized protein A9P81_0239 [Leptospira interrogans serovar Copenhageni/Icterohaemorrhagiae]EMG21498.1 hypothetical protein LEP1GSC150_4808 [Leptospira interrogans serovar Copenhageni str. LT2050]OCC28682.1 Uncharacterized protein GNX_2814 [Leptospira interrogans serovar Canicola]AAS68824.1 conserved hypothetical protein [Leptospira interrogans serovar Copenhageni str. Fiocruz L1-130]ARB96277.1 phosphorylase [Leptospira interrog